MVVDPSVQFKAVEGNPLRADRGLGEARSDLTVEAVAVHAEIGRCVTETDQPRPGMYIADDSGITLQSVLERFLVFLAERCTPDERIRYIDALDRVQTGTHQGKEAIDGMSDDEVQGAPFDELLPNVRLVNGTSKPDTRQRLMLTFNTPFYPEILIASSVMAEGVDLHLNRRHIIHHDLCWNPSTLEQRTGRVDRIGAKCEQSSMPVNIYLPYLAETQDEKMCRVVMDRKRWFSVVMGEQFRTDARHTERLAGRIPFPERAAASLAFQLHA